MIHGAASDASSRPALPDDFPRLVITSAISGYQSKLALVEYEGKYYVPGGTPPELFGRWETCEDLAQQLSVKSTESKAGKRSNMSEKEILAQYLERLLKTGWGTDSEMKWTIRRTAEILGWTVPEIARVNTKNSF